MSRSLSYLRRGLVGTSCAIVFGFGATQAFAAPERAARYESCQLTGDYYIPLDCPECNGAFGYCDGYNRACVCL